jgi:mono/diheme cytochrome c family protein
MKIIIRSIIVLIIIIAGILIFINSGFYNMSAMVPHNKLTLWIINTLKDNSIERNSKDIKVPDLNDSSMVRLGFVHYREMCSGCHGAPGISRDEAGQGLYPEPQELSRSAIELTPSELFWITKNGIKLTGMPAFGKTHDDHKIWAIVSFLVKLPSITNEQYRSMDKANNNENDAE